MCNDIKMALTSKACSVRSYDPNTGQVGMLADCCQLFNNTLPCHSHVREGPAGAGGGQNPAGGAEGGPGWVPALPRRHPWRTTGEILHCT